VRQVATDLGISEASLRGWIKQAERDEGKRPDGLSSDEREELRRLRRENRTLRMEREIESGNWPADGCRLHVCFGDENDLRVSEVWASREKLDVFGEKLRPRLEEAGIQLSGEPEVFEAHNVETF
jgi:transposase